MPSKPINPKKIKDAKEWPERIASSIEIAPEQSKLISSLVMTLENGEDAYKNGDYEIALFCFESASRIATELESRDWTDKTAKERFTSETVPTIESVLEQLDSFESEPSRPICSD